MQDCTLQSSSLTRALCFLPHSPTWLSFSTLSAGYQGPASWWIWRSPEVERSQKILNVLPRKWNTEALSLHSLITANRSLKRSKSKARATLHQYRWSIKRPNASERTVSMSCYDQKLNNTRLTLCLQMWKFMQKQPTKYYTTFYTPR